MITTQFWVLYLPIVLGLGILAGAASRLPLYYRRWRVRREMARQALEILHRDGFVTFDARGRLEAAATAQDRRGEKQSEREERTFGARGHDG